MNSLISLMILRVPISTPISSGVLQLLLIRLMFIFIIIKSNVALLAASSHIVFDILLLDVICLDFNVLKLEAGHVYMVCVFVDSIVSYYQLLVILEWRECMWRGGGRGSG